MQISTYDAVRLGFVLDENKQEIEPSGFKDKSSFDVDVKEILVKDDNDNVSRHTSINNLDSQDSAYLISKQYIRVPKGFIAYVFLKNRMSQRGLLALNTGIIDQNYYGPISTLIINLSKSKTSIPKDNSPEEASFFRVVFHQIDMSIDINKDRLSFPQQTLREYDVYVENRKTELSALPKSFLNVEAIERRISDKVTNITNKFSLDRLLRGVAIIGLLLTLLPLGRDFLFSYKFDLIKHTESTAVNEYRVSELSQRIKKLETELSNLKRESHIAESTKTTVPKVQPIITQNFSLTSHENLSKPITHEEFLETIFSK